VDLYFERGEGAAVLDLHASAAWGTGGAVWTMAGMEMVEQRGVGSECCACGDLRTACIPQRRGKEYQINVRRLARHIQKEGKRCQYLLKGRSDMGGPYSFNHIQPLSLAAVLPKSPMFHQLFLRPGSLPQERFASVLKGVGSDFRHGLRCHCMPCL
jgi:hypothetical protein